MVFYENFNLEPRQKIQEEYYGFLSQEKDRTMFFTWFEKYSNQNKISNYFQKSKNPEEEFLETINQILSMINKRVENPYTLQPKNVNDKKKFKNIGERFCNTLLNKFPLKNVITFKSNKPDCLFIEYTLEKAYQDNPKYLDNTLNKVV